MWIGFIGNTEKKEIKMSSNLPPGVTDSMLPGNRPEDALWEAFEGWALDNLCSLEITEAYRAVKIGMAAIEAERSNIQDMLVDAKCCALAGIELEKEERDRNENY
jgi:hypothetical protein